MEPVYVASFDSPVGPLRIASTETGIAFLELPHASGSGLAGWLAREGLQAAVRSGFTPNRDAIQQVIEYLEGKRRAFELPLDLRGTGFQRDVWLALREIPYGEVRTYGDVARAVGRPLAVRATGSANGANPVPILVPCHRCVAAGARLGGYAGGRVLKARLLALERDQAHGGALL
ncbi:Methylated-DNA--protein-cysteine methyltransferase, constitutive [Myxococcaceae bacterium]|jgi:O-6-methylguanine DNA methyltransferase|nr:Methylated-DNA--protein-cysteine methyltransferase, constitutive [Myxococcaceae bacterium]